MSDKYGHRARSPATSPGNISQVYSVHLLGTLYVLNEDSIAGLSSVLFNKSRAPFSPGTPSQGRV
jgi:hypothetical protein